jgi:hypothetical protein
MKRVGVCEDVVSYKLQLPHKTSKAQSIMLETEKQKRLRATLWLVCLWEKNWCLDREFQIHPKLKHRHVRVYGRHV